MTAAQKKLEKLDQDGRRALAIIRLCEAGAWWLQNSEGANINQIADSIQYSLQAAADLLEPLQDEIEKQTRHAQEGGVA